jgi:hypothetical protein
MCFFIGASIGVHAQQDGNGINGVYTFLHATVSAVDNQTGAPVYSQEITDSTQLVTEEFFFPIPIAVFQTVEISNGQIISCTLLNNGKQYVIEDNRLLGSMKEEENNDGDGLPADEFENDYVLNPMEVSASGNRIFITVGGYIYGSSAFPTQTLRGKYTVTMQKR